MKRIILAIAILAFALPASGQDRQWTEASSLTLIGKLFPDTPNPYHRIDTVRFKGFTPKENAQVRMTSGMAVAFRTNSSIITINYI